MINAILNGLLNIIMGIAGLILLPINALIGYIFPDLSAYLSGITLLLANIANGIAFVASQMPPVFLRLVITALTFLIAYYQIYWSYTIISKAWTLIQRVKFW